MQLLISIVNIGCSSIHFNSVLASSVIKAMENEKKQSEITLRPLDFSDVDDVMVWVTDDQVSKYCRWETYTSREAAMNYIKDIVIPHPWLKAICLDNRPVGCISVSPYSGEDQRRGELGYVLGSKYWGQGIATKAVKMVVNCIFHEWSYLERLEALVDLENVGSQRVLEKVGFQKEGVLRKYCILKGRTRDMVMYSFLSTDPKLESLE